MNSEFLKFVERNNIDIEKIQELLRIFKEDEINYIIFNNRIEGKSGNALVSIADIIGYDYGWSGLTNNIAKNFCSFFSHDTPYQSRSLGMLEYSSNEVVERLSRSFREEPMVVLELDGGRKIISTNGLHRYTVLRLHYLSEFQKIKGDKEKEEALRKKYEIPVNLIKVDLLKTYCQYLINLTSFDQIYISNNYDEYFRITGKAEVKENGIKMVLDDASLIKYTKDRILAMSKDMKDLFLHIVRHNCNTYDSFREFIDTYFSEQIALLIEEAEERERGAK